MANTTSIVGRLKCVHPDLGFDGGVTLEGHVKNTLTKLSDAVNSRYFISRTLLTGTSVDFEHNFKCAFEELRINLYNINGSDELTRITAGGTPDLAAFSIIPKVGSTTTHITITNNTGSTQDIAVVLIQGKGAEVLNDLGDVSTTGKEDGQALVYSLAQGKFVPGASGDASFKFQSINSAGTALVVKKGYLRLSDGRVLYLASDLTVDVSALITSDGAYYAYLDVNTLAASTIVSGRKLVAVVAGNFSYQLTAPEDNNLSRYISMGQITRAAGVFTLATTEAFRAYDFPLGADRSLEYTLPLQAIGSVGSAGQIAAGHNLTANSFPSSISAANRYWWPMAGNSNDASGNGKNLTATNVLFSSNTIFGLSDAAYTDTNRYLSTSDAVFNTGDANHAYGAWISMNNWTDGNFKNIFSKWVEGSQRGLYLYVLNSVLTMEINDSGNIAYMRTWNLPSGFTGYHHIAFNYEAATNTAKVYVDGRNVMQVSMTNGFPSFPSNFLWTIGAYQSTPGTIGGYMPGVTDELFHLIGAVSDNDIAKIYASRLTHNRTLSPVSQKWVTKAISADGQSRELFDIIVDEDVDDLYFDVSDEASTTQVELKLYNISSNGLSKAAKPRTLELTTDALDALLPLSHGLGVVPELSFKVKNASNDYEYHDAGSYFVATATQIKLAGDSLVTILGSGISVVLNYSTGQMSQYVPNKFWNVYKASASQAVLSNDKVLGDTTVAAITLTLPSNPSLGDVVQILDFGRTWTTNNLTVARNGKTIAGSATDLVCDISGSRVELTYDGISNWILN
jgi:hypothetical protein